jgi:hypothetical protein
MSILSQANRPWVEFDPTLAQHRKWFVEFQRTASWAKCPVRFMTRGNAGMVHGAITRKLVEYWGSQEFPDR